MKNYSLVKNYFPLYNKIFFQKNSVGEFLPCKECSNAPCERIDKVTFLPFESRFILKSLNLKKKRYKMCTVMRIETGKNNKCPFSIEKKCTIHTVRPIDCRTYPLVPLFSNHSFVLMLSPGCPHGNEITQEFYNSSKKVWSEIFPYLSESWKKKYNKNNAILSLKKIPAFIHP